HHTNQRAEPFDADRLNIYAGMQQRQGNDTLSFTVLRNVYQVEQLPVVNQTMTRQIHAISGQWRHLVSPRTLFNLFGQFAYLNYHPSSQQSRNVREAMLGVNVRHALQGEGRPTLLLTGYVGKDWPRDEGVAVVGRTFVGARVGMEYSLRDDLDADASVAVEHSDYGGREALFAQDRNDNLYQALLGLSYRPAEQWLVRPEIRFSRNTSSIELNKYSRIEGKLSIRRDFN
ncbi:MAG: DUF560 domain-containing protein, partial [Gammaproteobacteria bacterium]|nr:DUF560 domain-containing protein [Gammaproteobacteria bacterium]